MRCINQIKYVIFKLIIKKSKVDTRYEITLWWVSQNLQ